MLVFRGCRCSRTAGQGPLLLSVQSDAKVGDWVMLAVREGAITYHKAKVAAVSGGKVTLRHNDLKGTLEEVPVTSPRLWHGTLEDKAWEVSPMVSGRLGQSTLPDFECLWPSKGCCKSRDGAKRGAGTPLMTAGHGVLDGVMRQAGEPALRQLPGPARRERQLSVGCVLAEEA